MKFFNQFLIIFYFAINIVCSNSDMKKSWVNTIIQLAPNLEPDYPKFTPFASDTVAYNKENLNEKLTYENISTNRGKVTINEKLQPIKDYVLNLYKNYKKSHLDEKLKDEIFNSNDDDDINVNEYENYDEQVEDKETLIENKNKNENVNVEVINELNEKKEEPSMGILKYNIGTGVNVSLDLPREIVSVYLDEKCLKDVFTGRGRKSNLIMKILPLFILPFLIQSSFVPFLLATIKLLLIKSMVVGKIAILLLLIATFKNQIRSNNGMQEVPYYLDIHRRTENMGYQVEGRPSIFVT